MSISRRLFLRLLAASPLVALASRFKLPALEPVVEAASPALSEAQQMAQAFGADFDTLFYSAVYTIPGGLQWKIVEPLVLNFDLGRTVP